MSLPHERLDPLILTSPESRGEARLALRSNRRWLPIGALGIGLVLGIGGTIWFTRSTDSNTAKAVAPIPVALMPPQKLEDTKAAPKRTDPPPAAVPFNPFAQGMVLPTPAPRPAGLKGSIVFPPMNSLPTPPVASEVAPAPPSPAATIEPKLPKVNPLVAKGIPSPPPALTIQPRAERSVAGRIEDLSRYVVRIGGTANASLAEGELEANFAATSLAGVIRYARSLGGSPVGDLPSTTPAEAMIAAKAKLASLQKLREALLVTYLEDSKPVQEVDAEIVEAQKALADPANATTSGDTKITVKFKFRLDAPKS